MAMGQMISPGVYTRIIDLSEYLQDVPGTIGFIPIISRRGPDNHLQFISSRDQYRNMYGDPNIMDYGKAFGQGPYVAHQHLTVSSHLYVLRCLPDDATYSHMFIGMQQVTEDLNTTYSSSSHGFTMQHLDLTPIYFDGTWKLTSAGNDWKKDNPGGDPLIDENGEPTAFALDTSAHTPPVAYVWKLNTPNTLYELDTMFDRYSENNDTPSFSPTIDLMYPDLTGGWGVADGLLMYFRALGRGDSYNAYAIRISKYANNQVFGQYILDIWETQSDGDDMIIETFKVSFDPLALDDQGESMFIEDVVNRFSRDIRCKVNRRALDALNLYMMDYYKNDPTLPDGFTTYDTEDPSDLGYKAMKIELAKMDYDYAVAILNEAIADLAVARALPTTTEDEIAIRNEEVSAAIVAVQAARVEVVNTKLVLTDAYMLDIMALGDANPATAMIDPFHLMYGSEGSLSYLDPNGKRIVHSETATQILAEGYLGLLTKADQEVKEDRTYKVQYVDEVFDLDWIYFSLVYDAGYNENIKNAAHDLVSKYRMDCMLIADCTDNVDFDDLKITIGAEPGSMSGLNWNSRYIARYEPFSKIYDTWTGRDIWITPVYHMSQMIPLNDALYEIWYAPAGFNRGTVDTIKELRWSAKKGERDELYLLQINPIVHFPNGYTVWGQLTTQKRPTALQDLNVMRLVLYIKRALEQFLKYYIFEFNDKITWAAIKSRITPFLDMIKARRGLRNFSVEVGATEWEYKNKICHVNVILDPMKVIEKIELNLFVK